MRNSVFRKPNAAWLRPAAASIQLPRLLPRPLAMELALTGDPIGAERAHDLGLVNRRDRGTGNRRQRASWPPRIAENGPLALIASKGIIRDSWLWPDAEQMATTGRGPILPMSSRREDAQEGARAFAEKRKPRLAGEIAVCWPQPLARGLSVTGQLLSQAAVPGLARSKLARWLATWSNDCGRPAVRRRSGYRSAAGLAP